MVGSSAASRVKSLSADVRVCTVTACSSSGARNRPGEVVLTLPGGVTRTSPRARCPTLIPCSSSNATIFLRMFRARVQAA